MKNYFWKFQQHKHFLIYSVPHVNTLLTWNQYSLRYCLLWRLVGSDSQSLLSSPSGCSLSVTCTYAYYDPVWVKLWTCKLFPVVWVKRNHYCFRVEVTMMTVCWRNTPPSTRRSWTLSLPSTRRYALFASAAYVEMKYQSCYGGSNLFLRVCIEKVIAIWQSIVHGFQRALERWNQSMWKSSLKHVRNSDS